jgi:hypothetical protein
MSRRNGSLITRDGFCVVGAAGSVAAGTFEAHRPPAGFVLWRIRMLAPLAGYKTYIAAILAVAGALAGALDGDMTWQQASAIVVPAVIGAALRHGLSTSVASLISGVADALAKTADQFGKVAPKAIAALLLTASMLALSACVTAPAGSPPVDPLLFAYQVACGAYSQAKAPLAVAEQLGVFDPAAEQALAAGMAGADQVCSAPTPPADLNAAITLVNRAAAAVLIAVAQAHGKLPAQAKS